MRGGRGCQSRTEKSGWASSGQRHNCGGCIKCEVVRVGIVACSSGTPSGGRLRYTSLTDYWRMDDHTIMWELLEQHNQHEVSNSSCRRGHWTRMATRSRPRVSDPRSDSQGEDVHVPSHAAVGLGYFRLESW